MQHVLATLLRGNDAEIFDDDSIGGESYSFGGLVMAMREGERRMMQNPEIVRINVYEVFDGVRRASPQGKYGLVHAMVREGYENSQY